MFKQTNKNSFFGYFLYDQIVPKNHFLRKLAAAVDFSFVNELCQDAYPNFGKAGNRPYEPAMLFKIIFLAFLYNVSLRDMEEQINDRLSFKWFLGLAVNDRRRTIPRLRYSETGWERIFLKASSIKLLILPMGKDWCMKD